jgi:hypothetical protein
MYIVQIPKISETNLRILKKETTYFRVVIIINLL